MPLPKRAGKPPKGSRRNLRDTAGEKNRREVRYGQRQKTLRATGRAPVLPPFRRSGGCRRMSPCPKTPCPFCRSGPADRGVDQAVRFYRSRPVRRGHHHYCRGRTVCRRRGRRAWIPCPASGCPVSRMGSAPRILLLTAGRAGCQHPGNTRSLPADRRPVPHRNIPYRNRSPAGNCGPAHCHRHVPVPRQFFPCFFSLNFRRNPGETG